MRYAVMTSGDGDDRHAHVASIDDDGNGQTTTNGKDPHLHLVMRGKVLPARPAGHTHTLRELLDLAELGSVG